LGIQAALLFALAGCGGGPASLGPPTAPSSDLTGYEAALVADSLASLLPEDRGEIIVFENGQVYASSADLRATATYYRRTSDPNVYLDASGSPIEFPAAIDEPSLTVAASGSRATKALTGTGIAHSWYSNRGYSYLSTDVSIPCADTKLNGDTANGPKQGAFLYGGGISGTGFAADVGIIFNPPAGVVGQPTSVQAFINAERSTGQPVGGGHLICDTTYSLTSYVTERGGNPYLVDALRPVAAGAPIALMQRVGNNSGWSKVCARCRTKRVSSLAVQSGAQQTVVGTWFGLQQPYSSSPTPTITWRNAVQSFFASRTDNRPQPPQPWFESQGLAPGGDTPSDGVAKKFIVVAPQDLANEDVGFNETGPQLILR
jgi:hypothetical protein